jgi:hypothetical protein
LLVVEVFAYVGTFLAWAVLWMPTRGGLNHWTDLLFPLWALGFPVAMNLFHGDRPRDSGIRLDNLAPACLEATAATLVLASGLLAAGLWSGGFHWLGWAHLGRMAGQYLAWGPVQQYLLQAFGLRRLRQAGLHSPLAVPIAAGVFALVHAPNWTLVGLSAGAGVVWCVLFLRRPNLLALGLSHAALATLTYFALPVDWTQKMAIGRVYIERLAQ